MDSFDAYIVHGGDPGSRLPVYVRSSIVFSRRPTILFCQSPALWWALAEAHQSSIRRTRFVLESWNDQSLQVPSETVRSILRRSTTAFCSQKGSPLMMVLHSPVLLNGAGRGRIETTKRNVNKSCSFKSCPLFTPFYFLSQIFNFSFFFYFQNYSQGLRARKTNILKLNLEMLKFWKCGNFKEIRNIENG